MSEKDSYIRNRLIQNIRFSNRSGSHVNCFRYHKNNSDEHEDTKYQVYKKLIKTGYDVWVEPIFNDGNRADIVAIKDGKGYIVEILHSESEESYNLKKNKYPQEFMLIKVNTKDFNVDKFEI